MTSYSISCSTCGARLKVRDEKAIGELSICPKCGSMVMVTPPSPGGDDAAPRPTSASDSNPRLVVGQSSSREFDDVSSLLADTADDLPRTHTSAGEKNESAPPPVDRASPKPDAQRTTAAPGAGASPSHDAKPAARSGKKQAVAPAAKPPPIVPPVESMSSIELDPRQAGSEDSSTAMRQPDSLPGSPPVSHRSVAAASAQSAPPPLQPGGGWTSPSQARWKWYALGGVAGTAAMVIGIMVWGYVASRPGKPPEITAQTPAGDSSTASDQTSDASDVDAKDKAAANNVDDSPIDTPNKTPNGHAQPHDPADELPAIPPADKPDDKPPAPDPDDEAPPLFSDPPDDEAADPEPEDLVIDSGLGELAPLIDGAFPFPTETPEAPPAETEDDPPQESPPRRARPEKVRINTTARLADRFGRVETDGMPLVSFLRLMTQLSTVPITLPPEALAQVGALPQAPISLEQTDATVQQMLAAALASLSLRLRIEGDHVVVTTDTADGSLPAYRYPMDDLADSEAELQRLKDLITTMVAPQSWSTAGGEGRIEVREMSLAMAQARSIHFQVLLLCEKLRVARGMTPRSRVDARNLRLTSHSRLAAEKLDAPVRAVFHTDRALVKILKHLENAAGVTLLIDWQALAEAGWPPHSEANVVADGVPLRDALKELLAPMDLTVRAVDETTFQITSIADFNRRAEIEFYSVKHLLDDGHSAELIVENLKKSLGKQALDQGGKIHFDRQSQHLIVRLPQPQQRRAEQLLTKSAK